MNHAGVVDFNAGDAGRALLNQMGQTFQEREVGVHVEPFGLKAGKAVGNNLKALAHGFEILDPFFQSQISEVVGAELVAQEGGELLVLKVRFLNTSEASLEESRYCLILSEDLGYGKTEKLLNSLEEVSRLLNAYSKAILDSYSGS